MMNECFFLRKNTFFFVCVRVRVCMCVFELLLLGASVVYSDSNVDFAVARTMNI